MPTVQISLPTPHSGQRQVLAQVARFNVICCGRRFGKTLLAIDRVVRPALEGFPVGWFSPTYKMLQESWRAIQDVLAPVIVGRNNSEMRLELRGGGSITAFSLDGEISDVTRGRKFAVIIVDEAALVKGLRQIWESAIRPTLADFRGQAWFLSTPRGMNDFKLFFDRGQDPEREDWASWQMPTSANPFIAPEEIEAARQDLTQAAFSQEFLAEFVNWEGAVFRRVSDCATAERRETSEDGHEYVIGADWGRSHDYTVFVVLDVTTRRMVEMDRSNKLDYAVQRGRLQALCDRWRPSQVICELNSIGQPVFEELMRAGLPVKGFTTTNASKAAIVEALGLAFEQGSIAILNDAVLLGELQAFAAEQLPSGLIRYSAPGGGHDDCVMALAIAWSAVELEPINAVYRLTASVLYDDDSRPVGLLSQHGHHAHWLVIERSLAQLCAVEFYDDGRTIWAEREFFADGLGAKSDEQMADEIVQGAGDWGGLGPESRLWPGVLVSSDSMTLGALLRGRRVWVREADAGEDHEDRIRRVAALLAQGKLRIHERCVHLRREMRARSWSEALTAEGKKRPDPCQLLASRIPDWRLRN